MTFLLHHTLFKMEKHKNDENNTDSAGLLSGRPLVQNLAGPTVGVFNHLKRKSCLCKDNCKWLDFLVFLDDKP